MPAKQSDKSKQRSSINYRFIVNPETDQDIIEKLSSIRPMSKYIKQAIRNELKENSTLGTDEAEDPKAKDEKKIFWENFSRLLETAKLSVNEFAECIHVNRTTVSLWKTGKEFPRAKLMARICQFFGISRSELMTEGFSQELLEYNILQVFKELSFEGKRQLLDCAETLKAIYPKNT